MALLPSAYFSTQQESQLHLVLLLEVLWFPTFLQTLGPLVLVFFVYQDLILHILMLALRHFELSLMSNKENKKLKMNLNKFVKFSYILPHFNNFKAL